MLPPNLATIAQAATNVASPTTQAIALISHSGAFTRR
jgi:hypothetical protein